MLGYLMVDCIFSIEIRESLRISSVERFDPSGHEFTWSHSLVSFVRGLVCSFHRFHKRIGVIVGVYAPAGFGAW